MTTIGNREELYTPPAPAGKTTVAVVDGTVGSTDIPKAGQSVGANSLEQSDCALIECTGGQHTGAANVCHFEVEDSSASNSGSRTARAFEDLDALLQCERVDRSDPKVQEILNFVRKVEDANVKALLDAIDHSLEHARKLMEQFKKYIKDVVIPKEDALHKQIQGEKIQESVRQQEQKKIANLAK